MAAYTLHGENMIEAQNNIKHPQRLCVLIVEDDELLNSFYSNYVAAIGASAVCCLCLADAEAALKHSKNYFDAIILDNHLIDGEGVSLLPAIQFHQKQAAVVMVSGNDEPSFFLQAFRAGIHDYLIKPVNLDLLWLKITKAVDQLRLYSQSQQQHLDLKRWAQEEQQEQLLAKHLFDTLFEDLTHAHEGIHTWIKPISLFSGDAVVCKQAPDGRWYLLLADAMGHGLAPAISLMPAIQLFEQLVARCQSVSAIVFELNELLNRVLPDDRFIAAAVMRICPWGKQGEIWNGGLPPVLQLNATGQILARAHSENMALGVLDKANISLATQKMTLQEEGFLLLCSDGLLETKQQNDTYFRQQDIIALLELPTPQPLDTLKALFLNMPTSDDLSVCLVDCKTIFNTNLESFDRLPQGASEISSSYIVKGAALTKADLPNQAVDLLRAQELPQVFLQRVFTVCTELFVNALEHGVLALDSTIKDNDDGFIHYYNEKEQRLARVDEKSFIELRMHWSAAAKALTLHIIDSGEGFSETKAYAAESEKIYGRGLAIIDKLSFEFEVTPPGNQYRAVLRLQE